ncbi:MAG: hypothetical protein ACLFQJ_01805 [Campylobacterales bacterium]
MGVDNFIGFSIVNGFFLGLIVSLLKFSSPELILFFTILSTVVFYLIMTFCASLFVSSVDMKGKMLEKNKYDKMLEHFDREFDKREKNSDEIRSFIRDLEASIKEELQEMQAKNKGANGNKK